MSVGRGALGAVGVVGVVGALGVAVAGNGGGVFGAVVLAGTMMVTSVRRSNLITSVNVNAFYVDRVAL